MMTPAFHLKSHVEQLQPVLLPPEDVNTEQGYLKIPKPRGRKQGGTFTICLGEN